MTRLLFNPADASGYRSAARPGAAEAFHRQLPGYVPTPLHDLPQVAARLGLGRVVLKDESSRLGLPAFKILGASWAIYRLACERLGEARFDWTTLDDLRTGFAPLRPLTLTTATDGNHGRAVARVARLFGFEASIYVPASTAEARISAIESEGASVTVVEGTYDDAVRAAAATASERVIVVSDTSWDGYTTIPERVIEGYATLFREVDAALGLDIRPSLVLVPVGVGALAAAAVRHYRQPGHSAAIVAVEPESAACVFESVKEGRLVTVPGPHTSMMAGLNCGTPSAVAWPDMRDGIDAFLALDDARVVEAMRLAADAGVVSGETGAACLAGLLELLDGPSATEARRSLGIDANTVALVLSTEGDTDPVAYERIVGRPASEVRST